MLVLSGELDVQTVPILADALGTMLDGDGPVVMDLSDLRFIDSTGIRAILAAVGSRASGCVILHGPGDGVANVLEIADLAWVPQLHVDGCSETHPRG